MEGEERGAGGCGYLSMGRRGRVERGAAPILKPVPESNKVCKKEKEQQIRCRLYDWLLWQADTGENQRIDK